MVPEFDNFCWNPETVGVVQGPVKTNFGYHLILVTQLKLDNQEISKCEASHILVDSEKLCKEIKLKLVDLDKDKLLDAFA